MEHPMLSPNLLLADLLADNPQLVNLLIELHVDCVGCSMNKFCTLQDLCTHYELDFENLVAKISTLALKNTSGNFTNGLDAAQWLC